MYPKKLENETQQDFFSNEDCFKGKNNYIRTYLHTDYNYKMHSHEFYEINIIMSGSGRHYIDDVSLDTEVGDVFVIPPGISHGYYSEAKLDIYHVLIKNDFLRRYAEELSQIDGFDLLFNIEPQIRRASGKNFNLRGRKVPMELYREKLREMEIAGENSKYVHMNILALELICSLCENIQDGAAESGDTEILGVIEYIRGNLDKKLTLRELAASANMSISTFCRYFKAVTGMPPMQYTLQCRVTAARRLAEDGKYNKTEIAQLCGFYDLAHMNKYI